jgi:hypothetical protein
MISNRPEYCSMKIAPSYAILPDSSRVGPTLVNECRTSPHNIEEEVWLRFNSRVPNTRHVSQLSRWKAGRPEAADMPRPNGTLTYFHDSNLPRPLSRIHSAGPSAPQPPKLHPPPPIQQFRRAMPTVRIDVLGPRMIGLIWGPFLCPRGRPCSQPRLAYVPGRAPQLSPLSFPC